MRNGRAASWLGMLPLLGALAWAACAGPEEPPKPAPTPTRPANREPPAEIEYVDPGTSLPGRVHVVRRNETLYSLSLQYYGDAGQWRRIWAANKRRLADPKDLPVGMKLIIP